MFMGDYNAFGQFSPYFYGRGMQTTIPGIGRVNQMMFIYQREINDFLDIYVGVNAAKYTFPYSVGQSFGVSGGMTLHPADDFHLTVFGAYSPDNGIISTVRIMEPPLVTILQTVLEWRLVYKGIMMCDKDGRLHRWSFHPISFVSLN